MRSQLDVAENKLNAYRQQKDSVDLPLEALFLVKENHTTPACAEVGMVVRAEKDVQGDIAVRYRAKKAAHYAKNSSESVMGSMYLPSR